MRRLILTLLFGLALVPSAYAASSATGDGALSIVNANVASISISGKGTIYGQLDKGTIVVTDADLTDGTPLVTGWDKRVPKGITVTYSGKNMTFRLVGGAFRLAIAGTNVDFLAVGVGKAYLVGDPKAADPGTYTVDGAKAKAIPVAPAVAPPAGTTWGGLAVPFGKQPLSSVPGQ